MNIRTEQQTDMQTDEFHEHHVRICGAHSGSSKQGLLVIVPYIIGASFSEPHHVRLTVKSVFLLGIVATLYGGVQPKIHQKPFKC